MSSPPTPPPPLPPPFGHGADRACFDGFLLSVLAFGALLMLFAQLAEVLQHRPSRDQTFWNIVSYSSALFVFMMTAIVGKIRCAEELHVLHSNVPGGSRAYFSTHAVPWCQVLVQIIGVILPCLADILMFYRVMVLYPRQWMVLIIPAALYVGRIGISIPVILTETKPTSIRDVKSHYHYNVALASVFIALNLTFSALIFFRLFTMRHKAERVFGRLRATLYTSYTTLLVESGALFTVWSLIYLIVWSIGSWMTEVFSQPFGYIMVLTRMLIVLRMAQNRAWTGDIITAAEDGMLEWNITSSISIELPHRHHHEDRAGQSSCSTSA